VYSRETLQAYKSLTKEELRTMLPATFSDEAISTGEAKPKLTAGKFWVFKDLPGRKDNVISVSIAIEKPHLIVITTMVNWRPH
jgi:hypothetical protein